MSKKWYYAHKGVQFGPVSSAELKKLAQEGQLLPTDLVWKVGMAEWVPASKVRNLFTQDSPHEEASAPGGELPSTTPLVEGSSPPPGIPPAAPSSSTMPQDSVSSPPHDTSAFGTDEVTFRQISMPPPPSSPADFDSEEIYEYLIKQAWLSWIIPPLPVISEDGKPKLNHRGGYLLTSSILLFLLLPVCAPLMYVALIMGVYLIDTSRHRIEIGETLILRLPTLLPIIMHLTYVMTNLVVCMIASKDIKLMNNNSMTLTGYSITCASYILTLFNLLIILIIDFLLLLGFLLGVAMYSRRTF